MQVELKSLQREVGIAFVFVTHDQEEAMVMSDRIALLRSGELEQVATPREIYSRPATAYVAQFIGHTNLLKAEVRGGVVALRVACMARPPFPTAPALFSLRPEHIRLADAAHFGSGIVRVRGRVLHQAFHGATELIRVECADGLVLSVRTASGSGAAERSGTGILRRRCGPGARVSGKNLMFSRAYKTAVTVPPLLWVTVFLLVPYLLMFCYSFWSVSPSQTIVHSWNLDNYKELFAEDGLLANAVALHVDRRARDAVLAAAGISAGIFSCRSMRASEKICCINW